MRRESNRVVLSKRLVVYLTGIALVLIAVSLIAAVSSTYFVAWRDFAQGVGVNTITVPGITDTHGNGSNLLVNMTMTAEYPKAVIESRQLFTVNLTFSVTLDPNITTFANQHLEIQIQSNSKYDNLYPQFIDTGLGRSSLSPIQPYRTNNSLTVSPSEWPSFSQDDVSHMLDFTDKFEIHPTISLYFEWISQSFTIRNGDVSGPVINWGFFEVDFNLTDYHPISIYRFNYPATLWIIFGYSIPTMVTVPTYLLYKRSKEKKTPVFSP